MGFVLLGFLLLWQDNWRQVLEIFSQSRLEWLVPFLLISVALIGLSCIKWGLFLKEQGARVAIGRLFSLYLIGTFFNNFMPSNVGGDVVRSYMLGKQIKTQAGAMASVFLERLTGFVAMVTIAVGAFILRPELREESLVLISILVMGSISSIVVFVILKPAIVSWFVEKFSRFQFIKPIESKILHFHECLLLFKGKKKLISKAMVYSYLFYIFATINVYLAAELLGVNCNFFELLIITPIVMLIAALPLTPNSIGLWEWAFSVFLVSAGATTQEGLAIALALRSKTILISLIGGIIFLFYRRTLKQVDRTNLENLNSLSPDSNGAVFAERKT